MSGLAIQDLVGGYASADHIVKGVSLNAGQSLEARCD